MARWIIGATLGSTNREKSVYLVNTLFLSIRGIIMRSVLNLLFPRKCVLCQAILKWNEANICRSCGKDHTPRPKGKKKLRYIDDWYGLWHYQGKVRESIHRYKFSGRQNYAQSYAALLADQLQADPSWDVITYVPISRRRYKSRGYDQGRLLAEGLGRELKIKAMPLIKKIAETETQSRLQGEAQRRANVIGVYRCVHIEQIRGKHILLVDDVLTSGATACECAKELKMTGASSVFLATVAASPALK